MPLFNAVASETVILHRSGVYREQKLYQHEGYLYAGNGSTFVRLHKGGSTSTGAKWTKITVDHIHDNMGRIKIATQLKYEG